ncbi:MULTISPECIES: hypothetical protein [Halomicrobium]|uniref:Uncharacterized protein n=2 Tax=Halomicrobium mukohataei TaxID=57705 RepID=C7NZA2_HALMD|nr:MULTISPECIES: hypothetical protein [Halomicrobium]ACV46788.1 hypothetical protein Hmuk_0656 [Halomicrobium mukohataei DSM 12286]QCD65293.1 hypothetical protein E5139_06430 [Halomicrobium mukohataei]QFR20099.1 hypothetical protein GBQ70_06425 [Halomicrobium sp. ZPS1]
MKSFSIDKVRTIWVGIISIGCAFSVAAWVLPQLSDLYVKVFVGLQIAIATPLAVRHIAKRVELSGRLYRLYKVWFVLLLPLYVALGTVVPMDAVTSARVFVGGFVISLLFATLIVARDIDEALWRLIDEHTP